MALQVAGAARAQAAGDSIGHGARSQPLERPTRFT